jgi:hypothetical protein
MKVLVTSTLLLLSGSVAVNASAKSAYVMFKETPAKTVCIKAANATDANAFFSASTSYFFEVYKPGTKTDLLDIVNKLKSQEGVEACSPGTITGDYCAITLTLKTKKDKAWFVNAFSKAGLNHVKMNNGEAVEISKL